MKKILLISVFIITVGINLKSITFAQGMMGNGSVGSDGHTAKEEAEGKTVWDKLNAKELACKDLTDDNFETIGEYFMGQMIGTSHEAMNNMMVQMLGEKGEEQMHEVMGKRLSGCDISAVYPAQGTGFMPMMQMISGFNSGNNSMMNFGNRSIGWPGWIFMFLWWALSIVGFISLIKWLVSLSAGPHNREKSSLEILKVRYAKGEIDKKEFESRKKDLI